jgi:H+-translocating NAD(P) transhydrogenase subunit alpha
LHRAGAPVSILKTFSVVFFLSRATLPPIAMANAPFLEMYVFLLAGFLGYQIITRVPALLHTPLMSATNAISGISLVGSLVAAGADRGTLSTTLGVLAVISATINVVGGFMITDRMLKMFKRQEKK